MKFKYLITVLLIMVSFMFIPVRTHAYDFFSNPNNSSSACGTGNNTKPSPVCQAPNSTKNPINHTIQIATSVVALLAGVLAVIMIIVSGFTLITSGGNQEAVANSRKRITSAIIGLIIVGLAWTIIRLVTDNIIQ